MSSLFGFFLYGNLEIFTIFKRKVLFTDVDASYLSHSGRCFTQDHSRAQDVSIWKQFLCRTESKLSLLLIFSTAGKTT